MNCKVCGNAVNYYERTCSVCGNDLEAQRRETAGPGPGSARPGSYYAPPQQAPTPSLAQEKDQAVGRILYDNEGSSAHDRLEERRRKRQEEKAVAPHSGFPSLFAQERKEAPPMPPPASQTPPPPSPPPIAAPLARAPMHEAEDRPHRRFSNEFVFSSRTAPPEPARPPAPEQYAPAAPEQYAPAAPEQYAPMQQSFAIPQTPDNAPYTPQYPGYQQEPAQSEGPYFALKPSDDERARFDIDKKNEEFQELLDREFEKRKHRDSDPLGYQIQGVMPSGIPPDGGQRPYVQDRIDEYLRHSELDTALPARGRPDGPDLRDVGRAPQYPEPVGSGFDAFRTQAPPMPAPAPDFGRGEEPWSSSSYTDFDIYNFPPGPAAFEPSMPAAYDPPMPAAYEPPMPAAYDPPAPAAYEAPMPAAYDPPMPAAYDPPAPAAYEAPMPAAYEPPAPEPYAPHAQAEPAQGVTPWGPSRNEAPTRESIAAFIDRPIDFPFDEKSKKGAPAAKDPYTPAFDFEPVAPAAYEPPAPSFYDPPEPAAPSFYDPPAPAAYDPPEPAAPSFYDPPAPAAYDPPEPAAPSFYDPPAPAAYETPEPPAPSFYDPPGPSAYETPEPPAPSFYDPPGPAAYEAPEPAAPSFYDPPGPAAYEPPEPPAYEPPEPPGPPEPEPAQPFTAPGPAEPEYAAPFGAGAFTGPALENLVEPAPAKTEEAPSEAPTAEEVAEAAWHGVMAEHAATEPAPEGFPEEPAQDAVQQEIQAPDFVDLITEKPSAGMPDEDTDGPPAFYKAYTQGLAIQKAIPEEPAFAGPPDGPAIVGLPPEPVFAGPSPEPAFAGQPPEPAENVPDFLTAYDKEPLGKSADEKPQKAPSEKKEAKEKKEPKAQKPSAEKKKSPAQKKADARRTALSVIITILIVILVIVVACILVLKFMPDSLGAHYIQDVVELIQSKLGIGGGS